MGAVDVPPENFKIDGDQVSKVKARKALGKGACGKVRLGLWRGRNVVIKKSYPFKAHTLVNEANMLW